MLLPTTATAVLVALIISLLGWGSWVCFYKATKRIRFEFFVYDFTWGVVLAAAIAAFTLGSWDSKELTFQESYLLAGLRKMAWAAGSGIIFNLANMLLLAATSVSRISVTFPVAFAITWAAVSMYEFSVRPNVNPMLAFGGSAVLIVAAVLAFTAYKWFLEDEAHRAIKALSADPRANVKAAPPDTSTKALVLTILAGLLFVGFFLALREATSGDNGVASYGALVILAAGVFGSTIVLVPFFLNFPVRGKPLAVRQYLQLELRQHVVGVIAGVVWTAGVLGGLVALEVPNAILPAPAVVYLLGHAGPVLSAIFGLLIFRELPEAPTKVHAMMAAMLVLMLVGMGMIAVAPVYAK